MGGRSLLGLHSLLSDQDGPDPYAATSPVPTPLTIPGPPLDEKPKPPKRGIPLLRAKWAANEPHWWDRLIKMFPDVNTTDPTATSWGIPAQAGVAAAGLGGGWWLTDWLMRKRRQATSNNELNAAEDAYQKAIAEQYRAAMRAKTAGDDLGVDALFERCCEPETAAALTRVKQAEPPASYARDVLLGETLGKTLLGNDNDQALRGVINTALLTTLLGSGYATYRWTKNRSGDNLLRKAIQARARARQAATPVPLMVQPLPVLVEKQKDLAE